jgi:hypothetical protein
MTSLLAANHAIIRERMMCDTVQKSPKFLLEIMILVSLANNFGSDKEFILSGRTFIYILSNRGPTMNPSGTPCFSVPQSEKKICRVELDDCISTFCLLFGKQDLNQSAVTP